MLEFDRVHDTKRNIVWGLASKAALVLCPFLTRTALIYALGASYLGISALYVSVLNVLSLAELGFSSAVVFGMYKPVAEGDVRQVAAYLNYYRSVYRRVGLVILLMGLTVMPALHLLVKGEWPSDVNLYVGFAIYLANTVIGYFLYAYKRSLLDAYQRNDLVSKVNMAVAVAQCALQVALLLLSFNFYIYALVLPVITLASNMLVERAVRAFLPEFSEPALRRCQLGDEARRDVRKRVAGLVLHQVCWTCRSSFDSIFVSAFLGLSVLASYDNYYAVMAGLHALLGTVCTSMTAAVGNSVAVESREKNADDMRQFVFMYMLPSVVAASCLLACYQPFMSLWVGAELMQPFEVPLLMTAYFYLLTMGDIRHVYVNATGIWWEQRWRALAEAAANLVLDCVLVQVLGVAGVIIGTLVTLLVVNFLYGSHLAFKYYFGMKGAWLYYRDHFAYLTLGAAVCATTYLVCGLVPDGNAMVLAVKALVAAGCSSALLFAVFFRSQRFKRALSYIRRAR